MAKQREYAYQIKGNKLSIVEKDFSTTDGLNYVYSGTSGDGITDDIPSGSQLYKSPLTAITNGIEIEYTYTLSSELVNENDNIDLPNYLSQALVYYIRARASEDMMELEAKEYFMREFRKMVEKHENAKVAGPRRIMPGVGAIR